MASIMSYLSLQGGSTACKHGRFSTRISPSLAPPRNQAIGRSLKNSPLKIPIEFSGKHVRFGLWDHFHRRNGLVGIPVIKAAAAVPPSRLAGEIRPLVTVCLFAVWYVLHVLFWAFTLKVYEYFPFPFFVSVVHLFGAVTSCFMSGSFSSLENPPININLLRIVAPIAACNALGHVFSNFSLVNYPVSSTEFIQALEPFFSVAASHFVLGHQTPFPLWLSLAPIIIGTSMTSLIGYPSTWLGFTSDIVSTVSFTCRNVLLKEAMKGMDSTNLHAYISIISLFLCLPSALIIDGPQLMHYGFNHAIAKVGMTRFLRDLFLIGMCYHLYCKAVITTLEWVDPLTHAIGNVLERVFSCGISIMTLAGYVTTQNELGIAITIFGIAIYFRIKANLEQKKNKNQIKGT